MSPSPTTWNVMNLSTNQLTGAVPAFFTNGDYLVNVYVDGNNFSQGGDSPLPQGPAPNSPLSSAAGPAETSSGGGLSGGAIAGVVVGGEDGDEVCVAAPLESCRPQASDPGGCHAIRDSWSHKRSRPTVGPFPWAAPPCSPDRRGRGMHRGLRPREAQPASQLHCSRREQQQVCSL